MPGQFTYLAENGWIDRDFIAASTKDFDKAVAANKTTLRRRPPESTGASAGRPEFEPPPNGSGKPKDGGARKRAMFTYEKGLIWGNDNYRTNGASW